VNFPALATYYALVADEFLRAYFILGVGNVRQHARYFIMAHCLEVAFKASLANWSVAINYGTHSLKHLDEHLVREGESCLEQLRPDAHAQEVFDRMCQRTTREFFVPDWLNHQEALELLLCYEHIADLTYGIDKDGRNILAVTPSTMIMNRRSRVHCVRATQLPESSKTRSRVDKVPRGTRTKISGAIYRSIGCSTAKHLIGRRCFGTV